MCKDVKRKGKGKEKEKGARENLRHRVRMAD
jgi:hypothetical protein